MGLASIKRRKRLALEQDKSEKVSQIVIKIVPKVEKTIAPKPKKKTQNKHPKGKKK